MQEDKKIILKVLVGSHAHGLADKDSDYDYRTVYVLPTSKILSLGFKYKGNDWVLGDEDNTSYELGHFLNLATKCNPTILEMFKAPVEYMTEEGERLRSLFPYVWNPQDAFNAFDGYGKNQRKKFLDKKDNRQNKFAVAYIRTLYNLIELFHTGDFNVKIPNCKFRDKLLDYRKGKYKIGEIIDHAEEFVKYAKSSLDKCNHKPNLEIVNRVLLEIRRRNW